MVKSRMIIGISSYLVYVLIVDKYETSINELNSTVLSEVGANITRYKPLSEEISLYSLVFISPIFISYQYSGYPTLIDSTSFVRALPGTRFMGQKTLQFHASGLTPATSQSRSSGTRSLMREIPAVEPWGKFVISKNVLYKSIFVVNRFLLIFRFRLRYGLEYPMLVIIFSAGRVPRFSVELPVMTMKYSAFDWESVANRSKITRTPSVRPRWAERVAYIIKFCYMVAYYAISEIIHSFLLLPEYQVSVTFS